MSARAPLDKVSELVGDGLAGDVDLEDVDTIGGVVIAVAGRVPSRGEIIRLSSTVEAEIIDADPRKLKRLKLRLTPPRDVDG